MGYYIYKLCCDDCDLVYIGSTQNITKRKYCHKSDCHNENKKNHKNKIYQTIRNNGGWDNWRMVCIEELGDITKRQAEIREEYWRQYVKADLNMRKSYITEQEKEEYHKEYRKQHNDKIKEYCVENRDKLNAYKKEYREQNKNKIKEDKKEHYEANKDKILDKCKQYYEKNKDKILEKQKDKIICECGCVVSKNNLATHKKTKNHQELLNNNII